MSQVLTPINGGESKVTTTISSNRRNILSPKAIELRKLQPQLTEWQQEGRPIYRRLPSVSEAYQIDFYEEKDKAWVYIPGGEGIFGPISLQAVASDDNKFIIIKRGSIVWEYGQIEVDPVVINCELVGLQSTRYLIGYQLFYDDAPIEAQYTVEDFSLSGYDLDISASSDQVMGWRFPPVNAFLSNNSFWKNRDEFFPSYAQPAENFISWKSPKFSAYSKINLRCPPNTAYTGIATLSVKLNDVWTEVLEANVSSDSQGQFYSFELDNPTFQEEWKVSWGFSDIAISEITVSGIITLTRRPATSVTRSSLVAYPENSVPATVKNSLNEDIPVVLCTLAYVDVNEVFEVTKIDDVRDIVYRDYKPIAEWLTRPQDEDLIDLYDQAKNYAEYWMSPVTAMNREYASLTKDLIPLSDSVVLGN